MKWTMQHRPPPQAMCLAQAHARGRVQVQVQVQVHVHVVCVWVGWGLRNSAIEDAPDRRAFPALLITPHKGPTDGGPCRPADRARQEGFLGEGVPQHI